MATGTAEKASPADGGKQGSSKLAVAGRELHKFVVKRRHLLDLPDELLIAIGRAVQERSVTRCRGCSHELLALSMMSRHLHRILEKETLRVVSLFQHESSTDITVFLAYAAAFPHRLQHVGQLTVVCEVASAEWQIEAAGIDVEDVAAAEKYREAELEAGKEVYRAFRQVREPLARMPNLRLLHLQCFGRWMTDIPNDDAHLLLTAVSKLTGLKVLRWMAALPMLHWRDLLAHLPAYLQDLSIDRRCLEDADPAMERHADRPLPLCPTLRTLHINMDSPTRPELLQAINQWPTAPWAAGLQTLYFGAGWDNTQCPDPSGLWRGCNALRSLRLHDVIVDARVIAAFPRCLERLELHYGPIAGEALANHVEGNSLPMLKSVDVKRPLEEPQISPAALKILKRAVCKHGAAFASREGGRWDF